MKQIQDIFDGRKVQPTEEVRAFLICKQMGWDWNTYLNQPYWFIRLAEMTMQEEGYQQTKWQTQQKN